MHKYFLNVHNQSIVFVEKYQEFMKEEIKNVLLAHIFMHSDTILKLTFEEIVLL